MTVQTPSPPRPSGMTNVLRERLRAETLGAHLAAERAFDLPRSAGSIGAYTRSLLVMDAFLRGSAPALAALAPELPGPLRHGPERRRAHLSADLAALGCPVPAIVGSPPTSGEAAAVDPDRALGAWYVHEGSALGGVRIAAEVSRRLPAAAGATRFFTGEGRGTAARWRAFHAVLGEWEHRGEAAAQRVLEGARETFETLTGLLEQAR